VIDEVLAVGDAQFQKKCLGKMGEVAKAGRTVLFVSHNMAAVQTLCREAVWLDAGKVVDHGASRDVVGHYLRSGMKNHLEQNWPAIDRAPGNDKVRLRRAAVTLACESPGGLIFVHTPLDLHFEYWNLVDSAVLNLSVVVADETGAPIFNTVPLGESQWIGHHFPKGLFRSTCRIPGNLLNDGRHRIQLYVVEDGSVCIFRHDDILSFDVCDDPDQRRHWFGEWIGAVRPVLDWETVFVGNAT
jgi:lipopolysaccharide transport system ATP-binding protein